MIEALKIFLSLSLSGSIIALILFALKPFFKNRLSKTWQYYIWFIVILRLLIPFSFEINVINKLFSEVGAVAQNTTPNMLTLDLETYTAEDFIFQSPQIADNFPLTSSTNHWSDIIQILCLLWISVAIMFLFRKITSYHSFVKYMKSGAYEVTDDNVLEIYYKACTSMKLKKPLKLYSNQIINSPMLIGFFKPFIILPDTGIETRDLYNTFIHELIHYKRYDAVYKWIAQFSVCIHWFNPVVYFINNEINKNCELSCDEIIIKNLNSQEKNFYGDTLLSSLKLDSHHNNTIPSITLNRDAKLLKERLGAIMQFKKQSKLTIATSIVLTAFVFTGSLFMGSYSQTENVLAQNNTDTSRQSQIDTIALNIIRQTGDLDDVRLLIEYMSPSGIKDVLDAYVEQLTQQNITSFNESTDTQLRESLTNAIQSEIVEEITYPDTASLNTETHRNVLQSEINAQALDIIQRTGNWEYIVHLLPSMSSDAVDTVGLNIMQKTGNWQHIEAILPYMTNDGIDQVVALWNQKQGNSSSRIASNYYNTTDNTIVSNQPSATTIDYNRLAQVTIAETNDLNSIIAFASLIDTNVLDSIVISNVSTASDFNKTYAIRQHMSTDGIDTLVKNYVNETLDFGTVGAMLQFMSSEGSNYVAQKYFRESSNRSYDWIFSPYI